MEDDRNGRNQLFGAMESGISLGFPDPPDVFFDEMRRCFRLDGGGRMLALWCGAGGSPLASLCLFEPTQCPSLARSPSFLLSPLHAPQHALTSVCPLPSSVSLRFPSLSSLNGLRAMRG